jgi:ABC-type transport system substrate-binding protein
MKGYPNWDYEEQPHVVEYANRMAQFRTGAVWPTIGVVAEDIVPTKRDIPALMMAQGEVYASAPTQVSFGYEGDSPFKDKRMRQAIAYAIDRDLIIDAQLNRDNFKKEGLDLPIRRSTSIGPAWEGFWLDPDDDKAFGPNAKYFRDFSPAESKKLMAAAGFANGANSTLHFVKGQYSATYERTAEILAGMFNDVGIKAPATPHDYNNDYIPNYYYAYQGARSNGFNGMIYRAELSYPTCQAGLYGNIHKDGGRYRGLTPTGQNAKQGDPYLNSTIEKIKQEFDIKKAQE